MNQPKLSALDHLVLTVANIEDTIAFYTAVLGMTHMPFQVAGGTTRHALQYGEQKINLHQSGAEFEPNAQAPTPGSADLCFLTDTPIADWQKHLQVTATKVEEGPVQRSGAKGPIMSLYIRDPDRNLIEISVLLPS